MISQKEFDRIIQMDARHLLREIKKTDQANLNKQILIINMLAKFSKGKTVQKNLLKFTDSQETILRATAFDALLVNGHKEVINAAFRHLNDEIDVVIRCIELLGYHEKRKVIPYLIKFLDDDEPVIRFYAAII
ncbi:HEAT repeat domain-containing protein [Listeria kieliensis]